MNLDKFDIWLGVVIEFVPVEVLMSLLAQFDENIDRPTVRKMRELAEEFGTEFLHPLASLASEYAESDEAKQKVMFAARKLNKGNGSTVTDTGATGMQWFESVTSFIQSSLSSTKDIIRSINGYDNQGFELQKLRLYYDSENSRMTKMVVLVTLAVILILAFLYFQPKEKA